MLALACGEPQSRWMMPCLLLALQQCDICDSSGELARPESPQSCHQLILANIC